MFFFLLSFSLSFLLCMKEILIVSITFECCVSLFAFEL